MGCCTGWIRRWSRHGHAVALTHGKHSRTLIACSAANMKAAGMHGMGVDRSWPTALVNPTQPIHPLRKLALPRGMCCTCMQQGHCHQRQHHAGPRTARHVGACLRRGREISGSARLRRLLHSTQWWRRFERTLPVCWEVDQLRCLANLGLELGAGRRRFQPLQNSQVQSRRTPAVAALVAAANLHKRQEVA